MKRIVAIVVGALMALTLSVGAAEARTIPYPTKPPKQYTIWERGTVGFMEFYRGNASDLWRDRVSFTAYNGDVAKKKLSFRVRIKCFNPISGKTLIHDGKWVTGNGAESKATCRWYETGRNATNQWKVRR